MGGSTADKGSIVHVVDVIILVPAAAAVTSRQPIAAVLPSRATAADAEAVAESGSAAAAARAVLDDADTDLSPARRRWRADIQMVEELTAATFSNRLDEAAAVCRRGMEQPPLLPSEHVAPNGDRWRDTRGVVAMVHALLVTARGVMEVCSVPRARTSYLVPPPARVPVHRAAACMHACARTRVLSSLTHALARPRSHPLAGARVADGAQQPIPRAACSI